MLGTLHTSRKGRQDHHAYDDEFSPLPPAAAPSPAPYPCICPADGGVCPPPRCRAAPPAPGAGSAQISPRGACWGWWGREAAASGRVLTDFSKFYSDFLNKIFVSCPRFSKTYSPSVFF